MSVNAFDGSIIMWLNQFARRSHFVDEYLGRVLNTGLLKGGVFAAVLAWLWFARSEAREQRRQIITATVIGAFFALVLGRALATTLPYRARPLEAPNVEFTVPYGVVAESVVRQWSSFPSDHAMLFATLATGLWCISRKVGALAFAYMLLVSGVLRVYLGLHYPTDVLVGWGLGIALGWVATRPGIRDRLAAVPLRWSERHPGAFYAAAFLLFVQLATMFDDARFILHRTTTVAKVAACKLRNHEPCRIDFGAGEPEDPSVQRETGGAARRGRGIR